MAKHRLVGLGIFITAAAGLVYGCGDDTAEETGAGGEGGTTATTTTAVGPGVVTSTTTSTGAGGSMDEGTSCDDAVALEERENTLGGTFYDFSGVIGEPGDVDYFSFQASAGDWIRLSTDTSEASGDVNTVVTLFDESGDTQLAENNNRITGGGFDSEIAYRVSETGTYCVRVQDWSTWTNNTPAGGPTFGYRAIMVPVDFDLYEFYNEDTEPNDSTASPQSDLTFTVGTTSLQLSTDFAGTFASASDVDVYQWTAPDSALAFNLFFTPSGVDGFGSTLGPGIINIYQSDGATILAQLDVQKGADRFASVPVVQNETYFIEVMTPAGSTAGANDFYYLKFNTRNTVNAQEQLDEAVNDSAATPETAPPEIDGTITRHYVGGLLPVPDEDWWTFQAPAGATVALACSAWRAGGGTRDALFEIYQDPQGSPLESETEGEDADVLWSDTSSEASRAAVSITTTGTHYFRVAATQQDPSVTSAFYLCGIHVTP